MTAARPCKATNQDGAPCQAPALSGSDLCWSHDPAKAEQADAARRAGGVQRARQIDHANIGAPDPLPTWWPLETASQARAGLAYVVQETLSGHLPSRDANAATGALSALVGALRATDLQQRLELLERTFDHRRSKK